MLGFIITLIIVGAIAGFVARAVVPGRDPMGVVGTIVLGIVGSFVGGFLGYLIFHKDASQGALQPSGIIGSIIGAIVALLDHLDLRDATLVGFSMGGGEVARYLGTYGPDRVRSVVLAGAVTPALSARDGGGVDERTHLVLPGLAGQRPAVDEHDGAALAVVLVVELDVVASRRANGQTGHGASWG